MQEKELSFVIPTHRLREVGETVEQYDEHCWRNGHSAQIIVFDDSTLANQEKYYPLLEQTKTHLELQYVGPREKEQFLEYFDGRLGDKRFGALLENLFRPSTSVPDIIEEGKSGFVVDTIGGAVRAVGKVASLSRSACRQVFERRFDAARMAHDYVRMYERLIRRACGQSERTVRHPAGSASVGPRHAMA